MVPLLKENTKQKGKIMEYYPSQIVPLGAIIVLPLKHSGLKIKSVMQDYDKVILTTENGEELLYKFDQTVYCKF